MTDHAMSRAEIARILEQRAEEKFGRVRANELRTEIEQMADQLLALRDIPIESEDEP
jgi:hypothetical protein